MKLATVIAKNLKLLFRSKESAYTIVFGPILIILLVSFAFMGATDDYTIRVGTYSPAQTQFGERTINALNAKNYLVSVYPDQDACVNSVKTGATHACMVFSERETGNGTVPVTFYMDLSRTNIIYQISDDLEGALDLQTNEIRNQLAGDALTRMQTASVLIERDLNKTERISARFSAIAKELQTAKLELAKLSNSTENISTLQGMRGYQLGLAGNTRTVVNASNEALERARTILNSMDHECTDCPESMHLAVRQFHRDIDAVETKINTISQDLTKQQLLEANFLLDDAIKDLTRIREVEMNESSAKQQIMASVLKSSQDADANARDIAQVVTSLRYTSEFLKGEKANASTISTPVSTSIVSVTASSDHLSFTYPYLLVLVIMFIGMLLASTLIVADKTSRANFRNFTTPTSDAYHVAVSFITAFLLLVLEVAIILVLSAIFVAQPLFLNLGSTLLIIGITIVLFTFIGMIIGYLSTTQEAAMITSISLGSILLFVSNLIIPVEGMAKIVQSLTYVNPYLILSELLKKSMLYGVSTEQLSSKLMTLGLLAIILLIITFFIQRRIKRRYFRQDAGILRHVAAPLNLGTVIVHNEVDLLDALDRMTRTEFEHLVSKEDNIISVWVGNELRNRKLAKQLRTTSKERMMLSLDEYLVKHGRNIKR
jgi:ABC-type multidrug transport system permease subunit